jgi:hypothetical protein
MTLLRVLILVEQPLALPLRVDAAVELPLENPLVHDPVG